MTITRKSLNRLDAVRFAFCNKNWNVQLYVDKLFYPLCVDSCEYVIHLTFPPNTVYHKRHKLVDKLFYLYDNLLF